LLLPLFRDEYAFSAMTLFRGAILAAGVLFAVEPLNEPRFVRFELTDGVKVLGEMTAWDLDGFEGAFGRRSWSELVTRDVWRLYVAVMEQSDACQWVDLGGLLLAMPDSESWAQRAFRRAVRLDPATASRIEAVRAEALQARTRRDDLGRTVQEHRLHTRSPEARDWPAQPWPPMGPGERDAAVAEMKSDGTQILRQGGLQLAPLETDHFLVYADLPSIDVARLANRLESVYEIMEELFGADVTGNRFWGKAAVLYFTDPDRFRLVEAESFDQLVDRDVLGICQPVGAKVFINLTGDIASDAFLAAMARAVAHGFMHRLGSPKRLPVWANEGLAEYVASRAAPGAADAERRRGEALSYIRNGSDLAAVFDAGWSDAWPPAGTAVGGLMTALMIDQQPERFRRWVIAVKQGTDWTTALADDYGVPFPRLVETFTQYHRVND